MKHASLNQILLRILLVIYVFRLLPVTQYLLRGQIALKSALAPRVPAAALGGPRSVAAAALDAAAATAVDLAAAAQPAPLVEIVAQDEHGPVLIAITPEHAAIVSVSSPFLLRKTAFNVSSARWQLEEVEVPPEGEEEEEGAEGAEPSNAPPEASAAADGAAQPGAGATDGALAPAPEAEPATPAAAHTAGAGDEAASAEKGADAQYLDAVLRFRNSRTRKSHLILCSNADAARLRALHRRAVVRRQLAQIEKDVKRCGLPAGGTAMGVLREVLVAHALQQPLADRYCQGNNLVASALVRAFFCGVSVHGGDGGDGGDEGLDEGCASAYPHLNAANLALLRQEFVALGLFPETAPTARALARLRAQRDGGRAARAWAATQVMVGFRYLMETQGLEALSPSEGGRADDAKGDALKATLLQILSRVRGPLADIRAEAESIAAAAAAGGGNPSERASGAEAEEKRRADEQAEAAAAAEFARAERAARAAARAAEAAVDAKGNGRAQQAVAGSGGEAATSAEEAEVAAGTGAVASAPSSSPSPEQPPPPPSFDLVGAMLQAFDPIAALATLTIPPSRALLTRSASPAAPTAGRAAGANDEAEASAAQQAHILETWRAVLRAPSSAAAQSAMLKLLGARLLGYCHEVGRGQAPGRRGVVGWGEACQQRASTFAAAARRPCCRAPQRLRRMPRTRPGPPCARPGLTTAACPPLLPSPLLPSAAAGARLPVDGQLALDDARERRRLRRRLVRAARAPHVPCLCARLAACRWRSTALLHPSPLATQPCTACSIRRASTARAGPTPPLPLCSHAWRLARRSATLHARLAEAGARGAAAGAPGGRVHMATEVPPDKLEWLATQFKSGWRSPELERALLRTRLPAKLKAPPMRAD